MLTLIARLMNSLRRRKPVEPAPALPAPMTSVPPVGAYVRLREMIWIAGVGLITPNVIGKVIPSEITDEGEVMIQWPLLGGFTTFQSIEQLAAGYGVDAPLAVAA